MTAAPDRIEVLNPNSPGRATRVDAAKYRAMREAMLASLPAEAPGLTVAALKSALLPRLQGALFPGGDKAGWWLKCVQLDLEARNVIARAPGSPVRLYRLQSPEAASATRARREHDCTPLSRSPTSAEGASGS